MQYVRTRKKKYFMIDKMCEIIIFDYFNIKKLKYK